MIETIINETISKRTKFTVKDTETIETSNNETIKKRMIFNVNDTETINNEII